MEIKFKGILVLSVMINLSFILCENCGTPVECYSKAIEILKQDREEMIRTKDDLYKENQKLKQELKDLQNSLSAVNVDKDNKFNDLQGRINSVNEDKENKINILTNSINAVNVIKIRNLVF